MHRVSQGSTESRAPLHRSNEYIMSSTPQTTIDIPPEGIPPKLAAALVAAQADAEAITRDGKNTQRGYKYTTADQVSGAARASLTANGLAWMRRSTTVLPPGLDQCNIGNQSYPGDVLIDWVLVHESGATLTGSARVPIVAAPSRPHDKAQAASITYGSGYVLLGLLCLDREDENAPDRRKPPPSMADSLGPRCRGKAGKLGEGNDKRVKEYAEHLDREVAAVWAGALRHADVDAQKYIDAGESYPTPASLTVADGQSVRKVLTAALDKLAAEAPDEPEADMREGCRTMWRALRVAKGYPEEDWRKHWARLAGLTEWPETPTPGDREAALAGMRAELEEAGR